MYDSVRGDCQIVLYISNHFIWLTISTIQRGVELVFEYCEI